MCVNKINKLKSNVNIALISCNRITMGLVWLYKWHFIIQARVYENGNAHLSLSLPASLLLPPPPLSLYFFFFLSQTNMYSVYHIHIFKIILKQKETRKQHKLQGPNDEVRERQMILNCLKHQDVDFNNGQCLYPFWDHEILCLHLNFFRKDNISAKLFCNFSVAVSLLIILALRLTVFCKKKHEV